MLKIARIPRQVGLDRRARFVYKYRAMRTLTLPREPVRCIPRTRLFAVLSGVAAALTALSTMAVPATTPYDELTLENLAPAEDVIAMAVANLPKTMKEQQDWVKRMRRSALVPRLQLYWNTSEAFYREYEVIDRTETTRGSETITESGSENQREVSQSFETEAEAGQELIYDAGGQLVERRNSLTATGVSGEEIANSRSTSSGERRSSFQSTTYRGPDSYVTSEDTRWMNEFGLFLTWDLAQLVFHPSEATAARADADAATFRMELSTRVSEVYFDLVEALMLLETDAYKDSVPTRVRKMRGAFLLDQLTGGYITEFMKSGLTSKKTE